MELRNEEVYFDYGEDDLLTDEEVEQALKCKREDKNYKQIVRKLLINSVKGKKPYTTRTILDSMYMREIDIEDVVVFFRELIKKGTILENQVDRFLEIYENDQIKFRPYIQ